MEKKKQKLNVYVRRVRQLTTDYDSKLSTDLRACYDTFETQEVLLHYYRRVKKWNRKIKWEAFWLEVRRTFSKYNTYKLEKEAEETSKMFVELIEPKLKRLKELEEKQCDASATPPIELRKKI